MPPESGMAEIGTVESSMAENGTVEQGGSVTVISERSSFCQRIRKIVRRRKKGGSICRSVADAWHFFCKDPSWFGVLMMLCQITYFIAGYKVSFYLFRRLFLRMRRPLRPDGAMLYHWTSAENAGKILRDGLQAGAIGNVFLTDDPDFIIELGLDGYLQVKYGSSVRMELLKISAEELCRTRKVYYYFRMHEYITDFVPPEYISETGITRSAEEKNL